MYCQVVIKKYGGSVVKGINGKLLSIIETRGAVVLIAPNEEGLIKIFYKITNGMVVKLLSRRFNVKLRFFW